MSRLSLPRPLLELSSIGNGLIGESSRELVSAGGILARRRDDEGAGEGDGCARRAGHGDGGSLDELAGSSAQPDGPASMKLLALERDA